MKQKFLLTFLMMVVVAVFVTTNIYAQNKATVVKQNSSLTTYKFEEIEFTLPSSFIEGTRANRKNFKQYFIVSSLTIDEYEKLPGYFFNRKILNIVENGGDITRDTLINFFESNEKFVLLDYSSMSVFEESYKLENKNDMYIESALYNTADGMLFSNYLSYSFEILKNEKIFSISIITQINDDFVTQFSEYFDSKASYKKWNFIDRKNNGWLDFYDDFISENPKLPLYIKDLQTAYKIFSKTVK